MLTGLSRKELGERTGVSANTLTTWESPRKQNAGLSSKGTKRIIVGLKKLGIDCGFDWLYNGIGTGLSVPNYPELVVTSKPDAPEAEWGDLLISSEK